MDLYNETAVNVATLLQEQIGASRLYTLHLDRLELDADLVASDVNGEMRLTLLSDEILANVDATATVELTCLRCLEPYAQPTRTRFQEEFRVAYDVRSGAAVRSADDDERFTITDAHELDIREALRQELIVSLPMRPELRRTMPGSAGHCRRQRRRWRQSLFGAERPFEWNYRGLSIRGVGRDARRTNNGRTS